jgi:hypothetical protein
MGSPILQQTRTTGSVISSSSMSIKYYGLPANQPNTYGNAIAVWQDPDPLRTLAEHLITSLKAFFKGSPSQEQLVKMEVQYRFALSGDTSAPDIELPVFMVPATGFLIPKDWQGLTARAAEPIPAQVFIGTLADQINKWFTITRKPSTQSGQFWFDLSAFSSLSTNTQPLVRLRNLQLYWADITDLKPS